MGMARGVMEISSASLLSYFSVAVMLGSGGLAYTILHTDEEEQDPSPILKASMVIQRAGG